MLDALNNGVTPAKLQKVFLHASVCCGFPAAVDALRAAAEVVESTSRRQATQGEDEGRSFRLTQPRHTVSRDEALGSRDAQHRSEFLTLWCCPG
jgi:hypothetical protein